MKDGRMNEGVDLKRLMLYFQKRIWFILLLTALGAGIGALVYQVVRSLNMPVEYEAVSKLYISFEHDETGETYQYYNGYTWNELLDSEPVLNCIMNYLPGYNKPTVVNATKAEILSDIRLLTVTVTGNNEKFTREVQNAVQSGLWDYAQSAEELRSITTIRQLAPQRIYWTDRTLVSALTGALILGVVGIMAYSFGFIFNDAIFVQSDIEKRYPYKALGIMTRNQKGLQPYNQELKADLLYALGDNRTLILIDMENHGELRAQDMEKLLNWQEGGRLGDDEDEFGQITWHISGISEDEELIFDEEKTGEWTIIPLNEVRLGEKECAIIRECGGAVILVPFGVNNASKKLERVLTLLKNQELVVYGIVIDEADEEYLNRYFG